MPLHGFVGGCGHCWASHLAGMVYSNAKIDVRWRALVDVDRGITSSVFNLGGVKMGTP